MNGALPKKEINELLADVGKCQKGLGLGSGLYYGAKFYDGVAEVPISKMESDSAVPYDVDKIRALARKYKGAYGAYSKACKETLTMEHAS